MSCMSYLYILEIKSLSVALFFLPFCRLSLFYLWFPLLCKSLFFTKILNPTDAWVTMHMCSL